MRSGKKRVTSRVESTKTFIPRSSERISKRRTIALEDRTPATEHRIRTTRRNERKKTALPKSSQLAPKRRTAYRKRYESPEEPEIYKHQRLDTSTDEIRLLKLSRETKGPVHCEVKVFPLERAPEYIALSYRWGPPSPLNDLYIEGKTLKIRDILNSCLLELREGLEAWLWIDQICIAQENNSERNHQVGMMSRIYSNSMSVIIWMGDIPLAAPGEHDSYNDSDLDLASAKVLLGNTYFTRLWIIQEVLLANSIKIRISGHRCVTWDRLQSVYMSLTGLFGVSIGRIAIFLVLCTRRGQIMMDFQGEVSLMYYVMCYSTGICENLRDKVYGLMGMVRKEDRLVVDYEKSVLEVYLDFMLTSMNKKLPTDRYVCVTGDSWVRSMIHDPWKQLKQTAICHFELGTSMGIGDDLLQGAMRLVANYFIVHKNDTVTALGLDKSGQAHEQHYLWYECSGERHRFSCRPLTDLEREAILTLDI
jgi:hypothetical protein